MPVTFDLPTDLEQRIRGEVTDLGQAAKEAFLIDLYRRGTVSRYQLAQALGLDRFETKAMLKRHGVTEGSLSPEDLEADHQTLERTLGPVR
jgi:predicted HTH domain antitoxin